VATVTARSHDMVLGPGPMSAGDADAAWRKHLAGPPIPDPDALGSVAAWCAIPAAYRCGSDVDRLFLAAMNELNSWHAGRSELYARIWEAAGSPVLDRIDDLTRQPFLHANLFKHHVLRSVPEESVQVELSSSGTSGRASRMCFDQWSIETVQSMDARTFEHFGWITPDRPVNYLILGNEPQPLAQDQILSGAAYGVGYVCDFAPVRDISYALRHTGEGHQYDEFGCVEALLRFSRDTAPTRIFGFPSFLSFILDRLRAMGAGPLRLPPGSLVLTGGGWKGHQDKRIGKAELTGRIVAQLGVPAEQIRDIWGSVEHPLPYYECERHHMHVPTWARALVRSVRTLEPVCDGEIGYLQLIAPYITSSPAHSILMADLVSRHPASECGCGLATPWLAVHGRAGTSRNRSCAVAAAELLGARV
jgi:phenylacetate-coenzyme A ligase PaaK-like adenylate-forming protein